MANDKQTITVEATIHAPVEKVWECWTKPDHITQWNNASDDWTTPKAENDLQPGGRFVYRMEARDGSVGFDFGGTYEEVTTNEKLSYRLGDDRVATVTFTGNGDKTTVSETFEPESTNPTDMQQKGWQAILDNFKKYVEAQ